ncbi:MAG: hypothetical protein IRY97_02535 [Thermomicrobiaceae bacterium]|nr:hypothetical protein [Thermomicrobiaceae bacterium]
MPFGTFVNDIPSGVFLLIHLVAFLIGAYFAYRAFGAEARGVAWGFTLYAVAELVYMTYHLDWTVFLFAHTIAEVLDLVAFIIVFASLGLRVAAPRERHAAA